MSDVKARVLARLVRSGALEAALVALKVVPS